MDLKHTHTWKKLNHQNVQIKIKRNMKQSTTTKKNDEIIYFENGITENQQRTKRL